MPPDENEKINSELKTSKVTKVEMLSVWTWTNVLHYFFLLIVRDRKSSKLSKM